MKKRYRKREVKIQHGIIFKKCFKGVENGVVTRTEPFGMEEAGGGLGLSQQL